MQIMLNSGIFECFKVLHVNNKSKDSIVPFHFSLLVYKYALLFALLKILKVLLESINSILCKEVFIAITFVAYS